MPNIDEETRDSHSPVWDMSQERALIEGLMNQRFNFFLVFFSLAVAGTINARTQTQLITVLSIGAVIALLLFLVILRAHQKLTTILQRLFDDPTHPAAVIDSAHGKWFSVRRLIGYVIPALCCGLLWVGVLAAAD